MVQDLAFLNAAPSEKKHEGCAGRALSSKPGGAWDGKEQEAKVGDALGGYRGAHHFDARLRPVNLACPQGQLEVQAMAECQVESLVARGYQLTPMQHAMRLESTWSAAKQRALQRSAAYAFCHRAEPAERPAN